MEAIGTTLSGFGPTPFSLAAMAPFQGPSAVLYLEPSPREPFISMTEALASAFPGFAPYGGSHASIVPHVTVAQSTDSAVLARVERRVARSLPIHEGGDAVWLMEHTDQSGWRVRREFALERG